jgi:hypothetical protein
VTATIIGPALVTGNIAKTQSRQHRCREDDGECVAGLFFAGWEAGELAHYELKIAFDQNPDAISRSTAI